MSKIFDITDKSLFIQNVRIGDDELEVTSNALDVLKVAEILRGSDTEESINAAINILFPTEEAREKIKSYRFSFKGLKMLVEDAIQCATGADSTEGEDQTPAMT